MSSSKQISESRLDLSRIGAFFSRYAGSIGIILITYLLAFLLLWWSGFAVRQFSSAIIGNLETTINFSSNVYQAIENLVRRPTELGYALMYYSEPSPFGYTTAPYGVGVFVMPLFFLTGADLELTMNIYILTTYALSAWAAYLLARYLLKVDWMIAYLIGFMVAFAQIRFLYVALIESLSSHFLFIAIYILHRFIDNPRPHWAIALGLAFWFTFFTSGYLGFIFIVIAIIIFIYSFFVREQFISRALITNLVLAAVFTTIISAPFITIRFENDRAARGFSIASIEQHAAEPASWFSGTSMIYRGVTPWAGEATIFLGFVPLLLSLFAWQTRHKLEIQTEHPTTQEHTHPSFTPKQIVVLYGIIIVTGYIITLGPIVKIGPQNIPTPYMILLQIPGFSSMRVPSRFIMMTVIGTAILSAFWLNYLKHQLKDWQKFLGALLLIGLLAGIELLPYRFTTVTSTPVVTTALRRTASPPNNPASLYVPINAYEWLANQPPETAVLHYPLEERPNRQYIYGLIFHRQPMLNGQSSFFPSWYLATNWNLFPNLSVISRLKERGIQYVLVHNHFLTPEKQQSLQEEILPLVENGGLIFVEQIDNVDIYQLGVIGSLDSRLDFDTSVVGSGWHLPEVNPNNGVTYQWTSSSVFTLDFLLQEKNDLLLTFTIVGGLNPEIVNSLTLSINDIPIELTRDNKTYTGVIPLETYAESDSLILRFETLQPVSPRSLGMSGDARPLGIAFDWLEITPVAP